MEHNKENIKELITHVLDSYSLDDFETIAKERLERLFENQAIFEEYCELYNFEG